VSVLDHFNGLDFVGGGMARPPDTCGAAGPNSYVETVNTAVEIYNKTTGARITSDSLAHFLFTVGGITPVGALSDATMIYDEVTGQFIVGDMDVNGGDGSALDIAVSKTSNPTAMDTANWTFYQINTHEANESADYPGNMGYNADAFVFTYNMAPTSSAGNVHTEFTAISQADLAAEGSTVGVTNFDESSSFNFRPVTMHESVAGGPMWFVHQGDGGNTINLIRINDILTSHSVTEFDFTVNPFSGVNRPLNPDGSVITANTNGNTIMKAAEADNLIVASQQTGVGTTENDARWYEFNVRNIDSPFLVDQGNVSGGNNTYIMMPGIDINANGDIAMSYIQSGTDTPTDYMSVWVTGRKVSDPAGTMETPVLVRAGDANNREGRQGDFSGINVDADGTFWIANEYTTLGFGISTEFGHWGTEIAHFAIGPKAFIDTNWILRVTDLGAGDFIILELNSTNPNLYQVFANSTDIGDFAIGSFSAVNVQLGQFAGGDETVLIENTLFAVPVTVNEGSGTDTVGISRSAALLDDIQGDVYINAGTGVNTLNVYDLFDTSGATWTITGSTITRTGAAVIHYNGQHVVVINGGTGNLTYNVLGTEANGFTGIDTGTGADTMNVQSTGAFGTLTVNNLFGGSNHDTVDIGSTAPVPGGILANIAGTVNVANSFGGGTTLTLDDSGDTTGQTFTVTGASITGTGFSGAIKYNPNNGGHEVTDIHLFGGGGGNTFNVQNTALGTPIFIDTDALIASANNHVNIGSSGPSLGGTLANIAGPVNVGSFAGSTTLTVDDSGDAVSKTATLTDGLLIGLAPAAISWTPTASTTGGVNFLDILGGSGGNTFNVPNTSNLDFGTRVQTGTGNDSVNLQATTGVFSAYNNAGSDTVTIGSLAPSLGGTVASINAYVDVNGTGPVAVIVDDTGDATGRAATLTRSAVSTNTLGGMSPAPFYYEKNVTSLTVDAGSGNDSLKLVGTAPGTAVTFNGGGGANTLAGPDVASTFNITSLNAGTVGNVIFGSTQDLVGGAGNDTFAFTNGGSLAGSIDGGGGSNTLDYSGYTGDVTVNLRLGTASQVLGGVSDIADVLGSMGNDLIVGDANPNVFVGGTGRNIIIGGGGADQITGGGGDNILIAGTTVWDANATALQAMMQEWTNPGLAFDQRVNALRKGIVANGQTYALNSSTVLKDNSPDRLIGGGGQNWFFVDSDDMINNVAGPGPNDRVTKV
jgi:hypothetical protein